MARNVGKKRGAQPRPSASGGGSGRKSLVAFIGGLAVGLAIAGGVYLLKILPGAMEIREREVACADGAGKPVAAGGDAAETAPEKKPVTFDFYNMLTKQQTVAPVAGHSTTNAAPAPVVPPAIPPVIAAPASPAAPPPVAAPAPVPAAEAPSPAASAPAAAPTPPPPPAKKPEARYSLQAGSFATRAEADRRRGELLLSGLDATVQQVTTDKGDIRFRVIAGPFGDEAAMKKAQQQLAGRKIDTLPVRLK